jgi:hypothetical protein
VLAGSVGILGLLETQRSYLLGLAANGDMKWSSELQPRNWLDAVHPTSDGGYIASGASPSSIFVVKTDGVGSAAVQSQPDKGPGRAAELRITPPAFGDNGQRLRYFIPGTGSVMLQAYNNAGRRMEIVNAGMQQAGWHEAGLSRELSPGVYILRLEACGQDAIVKLVVLSTRKGGT